MSLLTMTGLCIEGRMPDGSWRPTVDGVDLTLQSGEVLALIGGSGAGKSTVALAALGYTRPGTRLVGGSVRLNGIDLLTLADAARRKKRGAEIAYVAQSAQAALNPAMSIGDQMAEPLAIHGAGSADQARDRAGALFRTLDLPSDAAFFRRYPHQLSGGQQQRVMTAMAMMCAPGLLVLDEPTTALDVTTQIEVLRALKAALADKHCAALYVSHDLAVVAQVADRIAVMQDGRVVEQGATAEIVANPRSAYASTLVAAFRQGHRHASSPRTRANSAGSLLRAAALTSSYATARSFGLRRRKSAVLHGIDLEIGAREIVAVIGESGSGKTTLGRVVVGLQPTDSGTVVFKDRAIPGRAGARQPETRREIQIIMQSPDLTLNPGQRVSQAIGRPLELYFGMSGAEKAARVAELLTMVGLPANFAGRFPGELSGGQRQRVSIARAFAARPSLIVCDEILASLDTLAAAQILDLMLHLRDQHGVGYLFISHDVATVERFADRVVVLYAGRVCEVGRPADVFAAPNHPYTALLRASVPELRPGWLEEMAVAEKTRPVLKAASGCPFFSRCVVGMAGTCDQQTPPVQDAGNDHLIYCHRTVAELAGPRAARSYA